MTAETTLSKQGEEFAKLLDELLEKVCGERMGFILMAFPFGREGYCNYLSNAERSDAIKEIKTLLDRWEKDYPDIPHHMTN